MSGLYYSRMNGMNIIPDGFMVTGLSGEQYPFEKVNQMTIRDSVAWHTEYVERLQTNPPHHDTNNLFHDRSRF
jgi:hypothetical protein